MAAFFLFPQGEEQSAVLEQEQGGLTAMFLRVMDATATVLYYPSGNYVVVYIKELAVCFSFSFHKEFYT